MERYPKGIDISVDGFRNCGWLETVNSVSEESYSSMWQALSSAAREAIENEKLVEGKILWLLADACSMMLQPSSLNEPFKPFMVMDGKRSALADDFQPEEVTLFSQIAEEITNTRLCARVSDLVWLLLNPRDPKYALLAIDQYLLMPITTDAWAGDVRECWDRAIQLCFMLKGGSGERLQEIEATLLKALVKTDNEDGYLTLWISNLLSKHKLGNKKQVTVAEKIEELAIGFDNSGDLHRARDFFDVAAETFRTLGNEEKFVEMTIKAAEGWVKEAVARQSSDSPSNLAAAIFYENAIQKYRYIPRAQRANYDVDNRITNLREEMNSVRKNSLDEMGVISTDPIDISELIEDAINAVKGKDAIDSLAALANIYQGANVKNVRQFSERMIREHPLQSLLGATYVSHDGRVIAKQPSSDLGGCDNEATVWPEMVKHYKMELGIAVQGSIWPALDMMRQEHRLRESDFHSLVINSPIVPQGRKRIMAKALFAGYDDDFVTALHILVPQLEHLIRVHLKLHGVKTTNLDVNGIENENGLSTLAELPEVEKIFGEDLAFEIRALLCEWVEYYVPLSVAPLL